MVMLGKLLAWTYTAARSVHKCGETLKSVAICFKSAFLLILRGQKKHPNIFLSLSKAINSRSPNHRALIAACSPSRILVESDFHTIEDCTGYTWSMILTIAEVKGWRVEEVWDYSENDAREYWGVVRRLEENWKLFKAGGHTNASKNTKRRRQNEVPQNKIAL